MNKSIKIISFFVLMISSSSFSMVLSGLNAKEIDPGFGDSSKFKDLFTVENAKITAGFTAVGVCVPVAIKAFKNWCNDVKKNNKGTDFFYKTKNKAVAGGITGLILAIIAIKYVKKSIKYN